MTDTPQDREPDEDRGHLLPDDVWAQVQREAAELDAKLAKGAQEPDNDPSARGVES